MLIYLLLYPYSLDYFIYINEIESSRLKILLRSWRMKCNTSLSPYMCARVRVCAH